MDTSDSSFRSRVYALVAGIPKGKVMTYGQIAALCGHPRAARIVGGVAHYGDPDLPWQRVVNKSGGLATGYPGGREAHQKHLEAEGILFNADGHLAIEEYLWKP